MKTKWSPEEEKYLTDNYGKMGTDELATALSRPYTATRRKIDNMGLRGGVRIPWSEADIKLLMDNKDKRPAEIIALFPDRPENSIRKKIQDAKKAGKTF